MHGITVIGHTDLISHFSGDLRYLTVPAADAQLTMVGLKALRPAVVFASLCPFDFQSGSDRLLLTTQVWQRWIGFRLALEASPSFRILEPGMAIDADDHEHVQVILHLEGADPIEKPADLEQFVTLGGRAACLTWNQNNRYAGGALDDGRLTPLGKDLLKRMRDQQVLVDLSHLNEASFWDVLNEDDGPLFASHSNAREVADSPRNLTRRQLHALRGRQAWVGIGFSRSHLTDRDQSMIDDVVAHLEYMVEQLGPQLVGLGTDFGGVTSVLPTGLETVGNLPALWERLRARNWTDEQIQAIQGRNFLEFLGRTNSY